MGNTQYPRVAVLIPARDGCDPNRMVCLDGAWYEYALDAAQLHEMAQRLGFQSGVNTDHEWWMIVNSAGRLDHFATRYAQGRENELHRAYMDGEFDNLALGVDPERITN